MFYELLFQSPCGVRALKEEPNIVDDSRTKVSVPLRGEGFERGRFKFSIALKPFGFSPLAG